MLPMFAKEALSRGSEYTPSAAQPPEELAGARDGRTARGAPAAGERAPAAGDRSRGVPAAYLRCGKPDSK